MQLKNYIQKVSTDGEPFEKVLKLEDVKRIEEVVSRSQTVVVNLDEPKNGYTQMVSFLEEAVKPAVTTVLIFPSESEQLAALTYLRTKNDVQTKQLLFDKKNGQDEMFDENVEFGLICGNFESSKFY